MPEADTASTPPPDDHRTIVAERLSVTLPVLVDEFGVAGVLQALVVLYPQELDDHQFAETTVEHEVEFGTLIRPAPVELPGARFVNPDAVAYVKPHHTTPWTPDDTAAEQWAAAVGVGGSLILVPARDEAQAVELVRECVALIWPAAE